MGRALVLPVVALALVVLAWVSLEANRHLAHLAEGEVRALVHGASALADPRPLAEVGLRVTDQPETVTPLLGEETGGVEVKPQGLRARAAIPWGQGALEVVRTYPLFLPSPLPPLLLALGAFLWAWARAESAAKRLLGLPLKEAGRRMAALEAAFSALDEGVAVLEGEEVALLNAKGLSLLGLPPGAMTPLPLPRVWPDLAALKDAKEGYLPLPIGRPARVRLLALGEYRVVLFQEQAELLRLAESLTQSRRHLELLRAQAHEFQNLLHVVGGLIELGRSEEALRLVQSELAAEAELEFLLDRVEIPIVAALVLGKLRRAKELGVTFRLEGRLPARYMPLSEALAALLGHLLENALEAVASRDAQGEVVLAFREEPLEVEVWDNGPGLPAEAGTLFLPGASSRGAGRGYGLTLARAQAKALGGSLEYYRDKGWTVFRVRIPHPRIVPSS